MLPKTFYSFCYPLPSLTVAYMRRQQPSNSMNLRLLLPYATIIILSSFFVSFSFVFPLFLLFILSFPTLFVIHLCPSFLPLLSSLCLLILRPVARLPSCALPPTPLLTALIPLDNDLPLTMPHADFYKPPGTCPPK